MFFVSIVTTGCIVNEVRSLGKDLLGAALVAKRFSQRRCGHKKNPVDASSCILAMIGKKLLNYGFVHCTIVHLQKRSNREGAYMHRSRFGRVCTAMPLVL